MNCLYFTPPPFFLFTLKRLFISGCYHLILKLKTVQLAVYFDLCANVIYLPQRIR